MARIFAYWAVLVATTVVAEDSAWSWNPQTPEDDLQVSASDYAPTSINSTDSDALIQEILTSTRQGRALDGYDEVYSDPSVQEVLQKGDDVEARSVIRERLCFLNLMRCDEEIQGKRPYIAPEELIYAQPVAINPVGQPIPTIPVKGVRGMGGYGPPRPIPYPGGNKFGPPTLGGKYPPPPYAPNKPPRRGYGPLPGKPFYGPPVNKPFLSGGEILAEGEFLDRPPSSEYFNKLPAAANPYQFELGASENAHHKDKRVEITVTAQGGAASVTGAPNKGLVEHVHHHYHHNADGVSKQPTVIVNPVPVAAAAVTSSLDAVSSSNAFTSSHNSNGFVPTNGLSLGGFGGVSGVTYGGQTLANYGSSSSTFGTQGLSNYGSGFGGVKPITENYGPQTFGSNSVGATAGYYGSSGLYKKELNVDSLNGNYLQGGYADKYQGAESARAENYDCVCVPYDQCPTHDVIGRKDDLYLAIDPRNLKSDIEAVADNDTLVLTDGNGTMTVVKLSQGNETRGDRAKREAPSEPQSDEQDHKVEGRQYGGQYDNIMKKIKPTFGISFGLPYQGGGGYPFNPHHVYPHHGTVDGTGVNLGLVSVNPLLSIQVTKDDYGNKVIKPFVNLHVTPNSYLVNKFEDLVAYKKGVILNKHKHFHVHKPGFYPHPPHHPVYDGPYREEHDFHHHPHEPEILYGPPAHHYHQYGPESPQFEPDYPQKPPFGYFDDPYSHYGGGHYEHPDSLIARSYRNHTFDAGNSLVEQYREQFDHDRHLVYGDRSGVQYQHRPGTRGGKSLDLQASLSHVKFPSSRKRRDLTDFDAGIAKSTTDKRQAYYGRPQTCGPRHVCCRRPYRPSVPQVNHKQCGTRHSQGINGRIKNPVYVDGDSEFGEYPWQVAILKKDPKESVYVCGGTLIDPLHILTAAHCVKQYTNFDLRVRLGEWDVNHDVEFYPYIERDVAALTVHPEFYAGTLYNDLAVLRMDKPVDWSKHPHISPACLPHPQDDYTGARCWTTGWGKDAFGDFGKYQNILKEVDVPIVGFGQCQRQLQGTRLGYEFKLHPGFVCAGGEEGKDACKGDGGGPMVCERGGTWQVVGVVSWGIGCGQRGVPGVYVRVAHYLDWIRQITQRY
ncbi:uncharacterized protein LOC132707072 [Cylas formicarius]|uniref:uncharacterized protein LOC132707072 n=1 Tax=Cylas formicarius TaxID=197179 RepID=UPI0029588EC9|nr:uncharacterized protein LOC132707072 [Cylas formicarius]